METVHRTDDHAVGEAALLAVPRDDIGHVELLVITARCIYQ
jgi:hypothetical protein